MSHAFDPDPLSLEGECLECGMPESPLHPPEPLEVPDFPRPTACRQCLHFAHDGRPCPDYVPAYPESKPCRCGWQEAS